MLTNILNIEYTGRGSEKQIAWAKRIFDAEMKELRDYRDILKMRVREEGMPEFALAIFDEVINDETSISHIRRYAKMEASKIIDYRGYSIVGRGSTFSIAKAAINKFVKQYDEKRKGE
jgi:hypothetical protein